MKAVIGVLIAVALLFAGYTWIALHWTYSSGERAGYVQKFSKKGWVCKSWEGQLAMATLPGAVDDAAALRGCGGGDGARAAHRASGDRPAV